MLLPKIQDKRWGSPTDRRITRVFQMVHELHKIGYQGLRICPGISGSGMYYRIHISTAASMDHENGYGLYPYLEDHESPQEEPVQIIYSSSEDNNYFGWEDGPGSTAKNLANKFITRFPRMTERSFYRDWAYAGWMTGLIGELENGWLPMAFRAGQEWFLTEYIILEPVGVADKRSVEELQNVRTVQGMSRVYPLPPAVLPVSERHTKFP